MIDKSGLNRIPTSQKQLKRKDGFFELVNEATSYLTGFQWCDRIEGFWLAQSWSDLVVIFLAEINSANDEVDNEVWVVVGDIPPAYIDIQSATNKTEVLECYVDLMSDWVESVLTGNGAKGCYPINVPPNEEYANMLADRVALIKEQILPTE